MRKAKRQLKRLRRLKRLIKLQATIRMFHIPQTVQEEVYKQKTGSLETPETIPTTLPQACFQAHTVL